MSGLIINPYSFGGGGGGGSAPTIVETAAEFADGSTNTYSFVETLLEDDLVIVVSACDVTQGTRFPIPTAGAAYSQWINNGTDDPTIVINYKFMESTPDTDVGLRDHGSSIHKVAYCIYVVRGVDTTTPLDVAVSAESSGSSATPSFNGVTTINNNALVLAIVALDDDSSATTSSYPSGYSDGISSNTSGGAGAACAISSKVVVTAGLETPGTHTFSSSDQWSAYTIALRPA